MTSVYDRLLNNSLQRHSKLLLAKERMINLESPEWNQVLACSGKLDYYKIKPLTNPPFLILNSKTNQETKMQYTIHHCSHFASLPPQKNRCTLKNNSSLLGKSQNIYVPKNLSFPKNESKKFTMSSHIPGIPNYPQPFEIPKVKRDSKLCPCISPITYYYDQKCSY